MLNEGGNDAQTATGSRATTLYSTGGVCVYVCACAQVCVSHQHRHEELVQVDDPDAAHPQRHLPIHPGGVAVALGLRRSRKQTETEAEDLLAHDGHGLWGGSQRGTRASAAVSQCSSRSAGHEKRGVG